MKTLAVLALSLLLVQVGAAGQDPSNGIETIRIIHPMDNGTYEISELTSDSILIYKGKLSSIDPEIRTGKFYFFYENGSLAAAGQYINDLAYGKWISYGRSNDTIGIINYSGVLNFLMKEDTVTFTEEVFFMVERMPTFNGGDIYTEFNKYMSSNLSYPPYAYFKGIQGRVIVQFMVDTAGNVRNPVIIRSSHTDLNLEALRVISESPKWQPGYQFNVPVNVLFTYPVNFTFDRSDALEIGPSVVPPKNKRRRKR